MKRSVWALVFFLAVPAVHALDDDDLPEAEHYKLDVEYRHWLGGLSAQIQKTPSGGEGTLIDVPADLGVEDRSTFDLRGILQLGVGHKLRGSWTSIRYDGDKKLDRDIQFGGTHYTVSTRVVTSIRGNYFTGDYEWDIARQPWGYVGLLIGVKGFDGDTVLVAPDIPDRKIESVHVPIPVLGLATRVYAGRLSGYGELSGLTIGHTGHVYELDLGGHVDLVKHVGAEIGYRRINMHGEHNEDLLDFQLSGIHIGADVRF